MTDRSRETTQVLRKSGRTDFALLTDHYLCGALVYACALMRKLFVRFEPFRRDRVREIVVSKYVGLGSILLTQKLLAALRREFPEARITFLTFDLNRRLLSYFREWVDDVVLVRTSPSPAIVPSTFRAAARLRRRRIDLFLDVEFFSRYSALMCFLSGPRTSVGYESLLLWHRTSVYSHPAKFVSQAHVSENFVNVLRTLGVEVPARDEWAPCLTLPEAESGPAEKKIRDAIGTAGAFLVFNPSTSDALGGYRKWPAERWAELARLALESGAGLPIVFTGLREDAPAVEAILGRLGGTEGRVWNLAGRLDLAEYLTLIRMSRLVVTVDSGTSHAAAALGKPAVVLFGPEWPGLYGYKGTGSRTVYKALYCSPCYNIHYGKKIVCHNENRCMTTISASEVFDRVRELLGAVR